MSFSVFLDWCPRSTPAISNTVYGNPGDAEQLAALRDYAARHDFPKASFDGNIRSVMTAYRVDGFFLFCVDWTDSNISSSLRVDLASIISSFVKERLKHVHSFDRTRSSIIHGTVWGPTFKHPVETRFPSENLPSLIELEDVLREDANFLALGCGYVPRESEITSEKQHARDDIPVDMPALLRLRQKFAVLFDKTFDWSNRTKEASLFGLPIYRSNLTYLTTFMFSVFS